MMKIFAKRCPHCKTGDVVKEKDFIKGTGYVYYFRCVQCGWEKEIIDKVYEINEKQ